MFFTMPPTPSVEVLAIVRSQDDGQEHLTFAVAVAGGVRLGNIISQVKCRVGEREVLALFVKLSNVGPVTQEGHSQGGNGEYGGSGDGNLGGVGGALQGNGDGGRGGGLPKARGGGADGNGGGSNENHDSEQENEVITGGASANENDASENWLVLTSEPKVRLSDSSGLSGGSFLPLL